MRKLRLDDFQKKIINEFLKGYFNSLKNKECSESASAHEKAGFEEAEFYKIDYIIEKAPERAACYFAKSGAPYWDVYDFVLDFVRNKFKNDIEK